MGIFSFFYASTIFFFSCLTGLKWAGPYYGADFPWNSEWILEIFSFRMSRCGFPSLNSIGFGFSKKYLRLGKNNVDTNEVGGHVISKGGKYIQFNSFIYVRVMRVTPFSHYSTLAHPLVVPYMSFTHVRWTVVMVSLTLCYFLS